VTGAETAAPETADWPTELENAIGPRIGDAKQRRTFAVAVLEKLADAYTRGRRAQNAFETNKLFLDQMDKIREGIFGLHLIVDGIPIDERVFQITREDIASFAAPLLRMFEQQEDKWELESSLVAVKPKRGRQMRTAAEITQMIAAEYYRHFRKKPGRSKQSDASNPFTRICTVLEKVLSSSGHKEVSLGYRARQEGLLQAGFDIAEQDLGFGYFEVCEALSRAGSLDPWAFVEKNQPTKNGLTLLRGKVGRKKRKRAVNRL
jgi:hypothetical protein